MQAAAVIANLACTTELFALVLTSVARSLLLRFRLICSSHNLLHGPFIWWLDLGCAKFQPHHTTPPKNEALAHAALPTHLDGDRDLTRGAKAADGRGAAASYGGYGTVQP